MARKINVKLILELAESGMSQSEIASTRHLSKSSVNSVVRIAKEKNIAFADVADQNDDILYQLFFPEKMTADQIYQLPDYDYVHQELKKIGVTLKLLWQEYKENCQENNTIPVGHTKFCDDYSKYVVSNNITNHLEHKPGERCEVDWSGPTMKIVHPDTGEITKVYLFVSCLTYSCYAYVEPTLDMKMDTWLRCHIRMYKFFKGVPIRTICDNLKTGVYKHPKEGEIILTDAYEALGTHYVTAIMPAGVRKPKQKSSAEGTVGNIATAIIAKLRNRTFHDFPSLQIAVSKELNNYNKEPFQKRKDSRFIVHEEEKEYLRPLPAIDYEIASWERKRKVYPNCHVSLKKNFYSVPYIYRGRYVDIKYTDKIVEVYADYQRIAIHPKFPDYVTNKYDTNASDMPDHFNQPEMNDERMRSWASTIGPNTLEVINRVFKSVHIKEQGYNAVLAILRLSKDYSNERFEMACKIALMNAASPRYKYLRAILSSNQDLLAKERSAVSSGSKSITADESVPSNDSGAYVRGADYYGGDRYDK